MSDASMSPSYRSEDDSMVSGFSGTGYSATTASFATGASSAASSYSISTASTHTRRKFTSSRRYSSGGSSISSQENEEEEEEENVDYRAGPQTAAVGTHAGADAIGPGSGHGEGPPGGSEFLRGWAAEGGGGAAAAPSSNPEYSRLFSPKGRGNAGEGEEESGEKKRRMQMG